ncbi:hypothetical protein [Nostoc sp.]|uniref:hypothetical protein n=1 Tax=Nostoc sp. TaxID=1180 RepID=UPI003FA540B4
MVSNRTTCVELSQNVISQLLDATREELALRHLQKTDTPIHDVAFLNRVHSTAPSSDGQEKPHEHTSHFTIAVDCHLSLVDD